MPSPAPTLLSAAARHATSTSRSVRKITAAGMATSSTSTSTLTSTSSSSPPPPPPSSFSEKKKASASIVARVVSAGRMQRAVKVQTVRQKFDTYLQKPYRERPTLLVSDPADSLRAGDVVRIAPWPFSSTSNTTGASTSSNTNTNTSGSGSGANGKSKSKVIRGKSRRIEHVVTEIITPFGDAASIAARPPVASLDELLAQRQARYEAYMERKAARLAAEEEGKEEEAAAGRQGDLTGKKIDEMRHESIELEAEAEAIERRAEREQGVDLNRKKEDVRL